MGSKRSRQVKPVAEETSNAKRLREAERENRKLKRQVAQAHKQISKLLQLLQGTGEEVDSHITPPPVRPEPAIEVAIQIDDEPVGAICGNCGEGILREIQAGPKVIVVCPTCKFRKTT